ncbi:MAG TPA: Fe2+/Zn2+ uptake regulation protein [Lachnospiraceae bacterium]|nr:Fe2+/Zn2+ uptake regulation protein [Lachnospiraceae bacterium]
MSSKSTYKTKQHEELLDYLKTMEGKHITVGDISSYFKSVGKPIGTATIYRHLEKMVNDGTVNKYTLDSSSSACFEYLGDNSHQGSFFIHYKCESCGKLIHLHCDEFRLLEKHLLEHHNFTVNTKKTIIYGICNECKEKQKTE